MIENSRNEEIIKKKRLPNSGSFVKTINPEDIIGKRFGKLLVESVDHQEGTNYYYKCKCDCGNYVLKRRYSIIKANEPPSCGCYKIEKASSDIIGKKFNMITVLSFDHYDINKFGKKVYYFKCKCDCGNECLATRHALLNNEAKSCGCTKTRMNGMSSTGFYRSYKAMLDRSYNPNNSHYPRYGGRGIIVCDRWLGEDGFNNFTKDMYDEYNIHIDKYGCHQTTIDRIDVDGIYEPGNCRWATLKDQANNKSTNRYINYNNETLSLMQCVEKYADCRINYNTVKHRLYRGWDIDRALHELPNLDKIICPIFFTNN